MPDPGEDNFVPEVLEDQATLEDESDVPPLTPEAVSQAVVSGTDCITVTVH